MRAARPYDAFYDPLYTTSSTLAAQHQRQLYRTAYDPSSTHVLQPLAKTQLLESSDEKQSAASISTNTRVLGSERLLFFKRPILPEFDLHVSDIASPPVSDPALQQQAVAMIKQQKQRQDEASVSCLYAALSDF